MRPLSIGQTLAVIQAVIDLNARLLGEEPELAVTRPGKDHVRVNYRRGKGPKYGREKPRDYAGMDRAMAAAWTALARARAYHEGRADWASVIDEPDAEAI